MQVVVDAAHQPLTLILMASDQVSQVTDTAHRVIKLTEQFLLVTFLLWSRAKMSLSFVCLFSVVLEQQ